MRRHDYVSAYVDDLPAVIDLDAIRDSGLRLGVDPLGGASVAYWAAIAERHGLDLTITNDQVDPTFRFVPLDWDGKIRMDCSSPYAMAKLRDLADRFDVAFANDPDADRHGIVTPGAGPAEPQPPPRGVHRLPLRRRRATGREDTAVGKTLVSSAIIDRVAADLGRRVVEVPVGFKWFVDGLLDGTLGFGGEESAGASFLRRDGGAVVDRQGRPHPVPAGGRDDRARGDDPGELYAALTERFGAPVLPPRRRRGRRASRRPCSPSSRAEQVTGDRARRRADPRGADRGARQRRADRRRQGRGRERAGSPRARRVPRTSTRSTPRASRATSTSSGSSPRPRSSWPQALGGEADA